MWSDPQSFWKCILSLRRKCQRNSCVTSIIIISSRRIMCEVPVQGTSHGTSLLFVLLLSSIPFFPACLVKTRMIKTDMRRGLSYTHHFGFICFALFFLRLYFLCISSSFQRRKGWLDKKTSFIISISFFAWMRNRTTLRLMQGEEVVIDVSNQETDAESQSFYSLFIQNAFMLV